jgi:hypothetical protein
VTDKFIRVVAYHEAGHAVVSWSLGIPIREVKVEFNGGYCSHALIVPPSLDPEFMSSSDWTKVKKRALILLGGEVAERVAGEIAELEGNVEMAELFRDAYSISFDSLESGADRDEFREVIKLVFGQIGPESIEWATKVKVETEDIVIKQWRKISSLAEALIVKRVLSGEEATQVIQNA